MKTLHTPEPWTAARRGAVVEIHAQNDMVGIFQGTLLDADEANARRIVACVNSCAGIDTEHLEAKQADHAEESEGGYLADVETRLEHTERELTHRSAALFERQGRVLSVMDELKQAVEARLAAEAQRDQLLSALEAVLANCLDAEGLSAAYANARAAIAAVKGGAA